MPNYQKLHYDRFYIIDSNGLTTPCTRAECFAIPEDCPSCEYKQRWYYDEEAGYALRLPRTQMGEDLGLRNQADLKKEERYRDRRATQISIDQPRNNDDGDDVGGLDFADPGVDIEAQFIDQDSFARLNTLLAQLKKADRELIAFLQAHTPKQEIADHFGISVDGVRYRELQLRKRIKSMPGFDGHDYLK